MTAVERSVAIARPREKVFEQLARAEEIKEWSPVVVESALASPPPLGNGSLLEIRVRILGYVPVRVLVEVEDFDPPRAITWRQLKAPLAGSRWRWLLAQRGGGTDVTLRFESPSRPDGPGLLERAAQRLSVAEERVRDGVTASLESLKRHLEAGEPAGEPA